MTPSVGKTKTKKTEAPLGMRFVHVVPLERPGVIEFPAWELAKWLGLWMKPWNERTTIPHLVFLNCPSGRQITFRMLILEGQAQMPIDPGGEEWAWLGLPIWRTKRSFAGLWMSNYCQSKASELKRGSLVATEVEAKAKKTPNMLPPQEEELYAP